MAMSGSGVEKDALGGYGTASGQSGNAFNVANPIYTRMATNPTGYTPQQKADMLTASADSLGGSNASAVGQGALLAARTNNAGGYQGAVDDAFRNAQQQQSENALGVENKSALLAREQQEQGLAGLSGEYADANSTARGYLDTAEKAREYNPWMQILMAGMQGGAQMGSAALKAGSAGAGAGA